MKLKGIDELLKGGNELHSLKSIPGGRICFIPKESREFLAKLKDLFVIHLCSLGYIISISACLFKNVCLYGYLGNKFT